MTSDLLDHLGVLLHDVQEAVVRRHGRGPLLRGPRQLLEQVGDDVVQTGAAARAHHRVWKGEHTHAQTNIFLKFFFRRLKGVKPPFHNLRGFFLLLLPSAVKPSDIEDRMYMTTCGSRLAMKFMWSCVSTSRSE